MRLYALLLVVMNGMWAAEPLVVSAEIEARIAAACPVHAPAQPTHPRRVLIFSRSEGFKHASIPIAEKAMILLGERSGAFTATTSSTYDSFDAENLLAYDAIILNNTTKLAIPLGKQQEALLNFVRQGKGIVGIHAATDNFDKPVFPEAQVMMGGVFAGHPWTHDGTWRFKVEESQHPLTASLDAQGFSYSDEIYQFEQTRTNRTNIRVLVTLDLNDPVTAQAKPKVKQCRTDRDNPVVWIRQEGKGRVFINNFGHNPETYWNKPMLALYLAGIQYALGDLTADDRIISR